jgi:hypothetical protein
MNKKEFMLALRAAKRVYGYVVFTQNYGTYVLLDKGSVEQRIKHNSDTGSIEARVEGDDLIIG